MTGQIRAAARELPVIIAGAGPAGTAAAIGLERAGQLVHVFEARGALATRARNIFLRPQARNILKDLVGVDPGKESTIKAIENNLRAVAAKEHVPIDYEHKIVGVVDFADHVEVSVQHAGSDAIETIDARMFIDASGGRITATNSGELERVVTSPHHVYVTAQYDKAAPLEKIHGVFDRQTKEGFYLFPSVDGKSFITYYDLPVGQLPEDQAMTLARYDALAAQLQLGTPSGPPQFIDVQHHVSRTAALGHILKIGDSAGNADPCIGAGLAAGLVDAVTATRLLSAPGDAVQLASAASDGILAGHRSIGNQASLMLSVRNIAMRTFPAARFNESLKPSDLGESGILDAFTKFLTNRNIRTSG